MGTRLHNILSVGDVQRIHEAALEVLETTGLSVTHPVALERLADAGARVDRSKGQVCLPRSLVEAAVERAPRQFLCAGREPAFDVSVSAGAAAGPYLRSVGGPINHYDLVSDACRPLSLADCAQIGRIVDGLETTQIVGCLTPQDVPTQTYDIRVLKTLLEAGRTHIWALTTGSRNLAYQLEMMQAVVGGSEALRRRPVCSGIVCVIEPLRFPDDEIERLLLCGRYQLPVKVPLVPIVGANAPYTLAGAVTQTNAEALGSLALLQTLCPGIPTWYYVLHQDLDMMRGRTTYLSPEVLLLGSALVQMARHYGIPSALSAIPTDCQAHQALFEWGAALTQYALAGADEIGGAGGVDGGLAASPEGIVLVDELGSWVRRVMQGFEVDTERLAVGAIQRVGHEGGVLSDEHTYAHLRSEVRFRPRLFDLRPFVEWQAQRRTILERAEDRMSELLRTYEVPPLEEALQRELDRILASADRDLGGE